ncbi:MAG: hypothetical protein QW279_00015 [Candidatus Jordarchaeaceae archaeon]
MKNLIGLSVPTTGHEREYLKLATEYDEEWVAVEDKSVFIEHDKKT